MAGFRQHGPGDVDLPVEHVARDFQIGRPVGAGEALAGGHRDHVRDALGGHHGGGEFGDRLHHVDMRQILQAAHPPLRLSALWPPICRTGLSERKAVAMPVTALVQPGPAVVTTQPSLPVWRA